MAGYWSGFVTVLLGILALATVAVLVSKNAQTGSILNTFWSGFNSSITAAVSPLSGGSSFGSLNLGQSFGSGM